MVEWIVSSSVLILIVTLLRFLLKGKIALRLQYALWALVLVRLLVPVSLGQSSLSVMNRVESKSYQTISQTLQDVKVYSDIIQHTELTPEEAEKVGNGTLHEIQGYSIESGNSHLRTYIFTDSLVNVLSRVFRMIWLVGLVVVAALFLIFNTSFYVWVKRSRQRLECQSTQLDVYLSQIVETPCLFGLFYPAIYITPEVLTDGTALRHILAHETTHYCHGDHIWALLRCVCLALHWYNPLVWLAASLSRRDGELACDEGTIRRIGEEKRMEYGRTLIRLTCAKRGTLFTTATTMTGNKRSIKERITLIAKKPKTLTIALVIAIVVSLVAVGCTFTGAETLPDASDVPDAAEEEDPISDTIVVGSEVDPSNPALEFAIDYVTQKIKTFNEDWKEIAPGNRITTGQITAITDVATIAMENTRLDLYLLEYRLLLDGEVQQVLAGGLGYEEIDGEVWLTERESAGQPYLLQSSELLEDQIIWTPICTTNTDEIDLIYSANKELETEFGLDKYTIAVQELYKAHVNHENSDAVPLTKEEIAQVNEAFNQLVDDGEGKLIVNPLSCFFTSYYKAPQSIDLANFLAYFPSDETLTAPEEFDALKASKNFPFDADVALEDMWVPVHKISAQAINEVLQQYADASLAELDDVRESNNDLIYLEEYDAYYNFISDFAAGYFTCVRGEKQEDRVVLYSDHNVLTLRKSGENYVIQSFQPISP